MPIDDFVPQFRTLVNQANDMSEYDKIMYFKLGLKEELQKDPEINRATTLNAAVNHALRCDTAVRQADLTLQHRADSSTPMVLDAFNAQHPRAAQPASTDKCHCSTVNTGTTTGTATGRRGSHVTRVACKSTTLRLNLFPNPNEAEQTIKLDAEIGGFPAVVLLDSGANKNFIAQKFVDVNHIVTSAPKGEPAVASARENTKMMFVFKSLTFKIMMRSSGRNGSKTPTPRSIGRREKLPLRTTGLSPNCHTISSQ